jgi:hypothetical protein
LEVGFIPRTGIVSWNHYHAWVNWHGFHFGFTLLNIWEMEPEHGGAPPMAFDGPACDGYIIAMPFWFIFAAFALIPVAHLLWRHRKNVTPGSCVRCGYDVRATPERCPECGTPAVKGLGSTAEIAENAR